MGALGLGHPKPDAYSEEFGVGDIVLIHSWQASLMSGYNQNRNTYVDAGYAVPVTPMIADIITAPYSLPTFADLDGDGDSDLTVAHRNGTVIDYFKNNGTHAEPDFVTTGFRNPTTLTLNDNGGNDTLDLRTDNDDQRFDLTAFDLESADELDITSGDDGVTIDLTDISGGSILLADITTLPDAGDFLVWCEATKQLIILSGRHRKKYRINPSIFQ